MKWSKYNSFFETDQSMFLIYNCNSEKLMIVVEDIKKILDENINQVEKLKTIHPELYAYLLDNKFIIENEFNETEEIIQKMKRESSSPEFFGLTINPTMNCNFKCWYCYETHEPGSYMNQQVFDAVKYFIRNKLESVGIKQFNLSFFGGEPLLFFDKIVLPLILYSKELCDRNKVEFVVSFTSNGIFLTPKVVDILATNDVRPYFQIPFDGNKEYHDKVKNLPEGKSAYDTTLRNIKYALGRNFSFNIRCNYTHDNIESFSDLIRDFKEENIEPNEVGFSFQKIWQTNDDQKTISGLEKLENLVADVNLNNIGNSYDTLFGRCYADWENEVVINYNGDVYNCTARDFTRKNREGVLNLDGTITYNEKHRTRMDIVYSDPLCLDCKIFPICDICSQKKLEKKRGSQCLRGTGEAEKENLLAKYIQMLYNNRNISVE